MLKLDLDSDQTVSLNWRRVASTHSFQVRGAFAYGLRSLSSTTNAELQELLIDDQTQPEYCKASTACWGYLIWDCVITGCIQSLMCSWSFVALQAGPDGVRLYSAMWGCFVFAGVLQAHAPRSRLEAYPARDLLHAACASHSTSHNSRGVLLFVAILNHRQTKLLCMWLTQLACRSPVAGQA
ncbi:hypothetical protein ABBQ32_011886 [Trebouxia sp. C0010 RCD-2024]